MINGIIDEILEEMDRKENTVLDWSEFIEFMDKATI